MFYYDDKIKQFEKMLDYDSLLIYLEEIAQTYPNEAIPTIVGYAWYFSVEGDVNCRPERYNYQKYVSIWKKNIDMGINRFVDNPVFDFIAGYSLSLHGSYLDSIYEGEYETKGLVLMKKCFELSKDTHLGELAKVFLLNNKSKKHIYSDDVLEICKALFNNGSLLDDYFIEIFTNQQMSL